MEAKECLLQRRSVRKYQSTPIPDGVLRELMECGLAAPSALNLQHTYFVVVKSAERRRELLDALGALFARFRPVLEERFPGHPEVVQEKKTFLEDLGGAPVCVLAFFYKSEYADRDGAMQSVSAAIENLLLAAWDRGLGSCWISAPQRMGFGPELQEKFAPDKGEFVAAITLGYPDHTPKMPPRRDGRYVFI